MSNAGISIFGRPEGQVSISNGLFKETKLGGIMYLEGLTDGLILQENESIGIIRQVCDASGNSTGITIAGISHFAKSYGQDRPGGFVGAAICFKQMPHPVMINKLLLSLSQASLKLIDPSTKKFLAADEKSWNITLPEPNDKWVQEVKGLNQVAQKDKSRLVVEVDGKLEYAILSVVQGILSNPEYNKYETTIITEKNEFLERAKAKGYKVISVFDLMNYGGLLSAANRQLKETNDKTSQLIEQFKPTLAALKNDMDSAKSHLAKLQNDIASKEDKLITIGQQLSGEQMKLDALRVEQETLIKWNDSQAKNIINESKVFKAEIDRRIKQESQRIKMQQAANDSNYEKIENGSPRLLFSKPAIFFGFGALMLIIGLVISYFLFGGKGGEEEAVVAHNSAEEKLQTSEFVLSVSQPNNQVLHDSLYSNEAYKKFVMMNCDKFAKQDSVHVSDLKSTFFMVPISNENAGKIFLDTIDFGSINRYDILYTYLSNENNIYTNTIGLPDTTGDNKKYLLNHFNWMVEFYSAYEGDKKDLFKTDTSVHIVPLIKK